MVRRCDRQVPCIERENQGRVRTFTMKFHVQRGVGPVQLGQLSPMHQGYGRMQPSPPWTE